MYGQILCFCLHAYEGCEPKPKDSVYNNYASQFLEVFQQEKSAHYTGVIIQYTTACSCLQVGFLTYTALMCINSYSTCRHSFNTRPSLCKPKGLKRFY